MKKSRVFALILSALMLCSFALPALAQSAERITSFDSAIAIQKNGSVDVSDTIDVIAENEQINHGIYIDLITQGKNIFTGVNNLDLSVKNVTRDGEIEPFSVSDISGGKRIYIGNPNVIIDTGAHSYVIEYSISREVRYFKDYDELYFNITGNDWSFPIDKTTATIILPPDIPADKLSVYGYTGIEGAKENDYTTQSDGNRIYFSSLKTLNPGEGLTVSVTWPKGYMDYPSRQETIALFLSDYTGILMSLIALLLISAYYFATWFIYGRDPKKGAITAEYEAPNGLSPAQIRYLSKMGSDDKTFTAAVIDMAVKGYLKIEDKKIFFIKSYTLVKTGKNEDKLSDDEKLLASKLFSGADTIAISKGNMATLQSASLSLRKGLKAFNGKKYFVTNIKQYLFGVLISTLLIVVTAWLGTDTQGMTIVIFMSVWLSFWTIGALAISVKAISLWGSVLNTPKIMTVVAAILITLFALPFIAGELFAVGVVAYFSSIAFVLFLLIAIAINIAFYFLMRARTPEGRKIQDKIEGFKLFLSVTEKDRMNFFNPPKKTPELFEKFLPYALALDVENKWAEQFAEEFSFGQSDGVRMSYVPIWYSSSSGLTGFGGISDFASNLTTSLSSAISSSSSSSGHGGGGSSGGGGGGGGGGGW